MGGYGRSEAKDWAKQNFLGVHNVTLPTFASDLKGLNEKGIRHDVRESIRHRFFATLLSSKCGLHHRLLWKYQGWLVGFNGGPLRTPVMRLNARLMRRFREALVVSMIRPTEEDDREFFAGRNPA